VGSQVKEVAATEVEYCKKIAAGTGSAFEGEDYLVGFYLIDFYLIDFYLVDFCERCALLNLFLSWYVDWAWSVAQVTDAHRSGSHADCLDIA